MNIHTLIGEASAYDKKEQLEVKRPKSWLKSVSAFANGEGGTLVFGISDDDQVVGLADAESDAERISVCIFIIYLLRFVILFQQRSHLFIKIDSFLFQEG